MGAVFKDCHIAPLRISKEQRRNLLQSQNSALQAQHATLRAANDGTVEAGSTLRLDLKTARHCIDELEAEAHEAEMVCRRLHNLVQELKGNIRVFAHVRPLLPSDVSSTNDEKARHWSYPDSRYHREIVYYKLERDGPGTERYLELQFRSSNLPYLFVLPQFIVSVFIPSLQPRFYFCILTSESCQSCEFVRIQHAL